MNSDDLRLAHILRDGDDGDVVIIGAPFDYVRKRCINKGGEDNGPCCLRRFFGRVGPIVNPEYGISIQHLKVTDFGNVEFTEESNNQTPQKCISKISEDIFGILKNNRLPFVLGGSKECLLGGAEAFNKKYNNYKHILISGKPNLKRPFDQNKLTSDNVLTILSQRYPNTVVLFGAHSRYFPVNYNKQFEHVDLDTIRKTQIQKGGELNTQAGVVLSGILKEMKEIDSVHVSLTVEAIERFRGCRDVLSVGLTVEQIIEIFMLLGQTSKVGLIDISEFNPSVQDYQSSILLVNLLYYFLMGYTKRTQ